MTTLQVPRWPKWPTWIGTAWTCLTRRVSLLDSTAKDYRWVNSLSKTDQLELQMLADKGRLWATASLIRTLRSQLARITATCSLRWLQMPCKPQTWWWTPLIHTTLTILQRFELPKEIWEVTRSWVEQGALPATEVRDLKWGMDSLLIRCKSTLLMRDPSLSCPN